MTLAKSKSLCDKYKMQVEEEEKERKEKKRKEKKMGKTERKHNKKCIDKMTKFDSK